MNDRRNLSRTVLDVTQALAGLKDRHPVYVRKDSE